MKKELTIFSGIFLVKDNKVLLLKRKSNGELNGFRGPAGGHLGYGETMIDSAIRETLEEIGITIKKENIINQTLVLNRNSIGNRNFIGYYGLCKIRDGNPINNEPHKTSKLSRYKISNLPEETTKCTRLGLEALLNNKMYVEIN